METDRLREFIVLAKHGRLAPAARELYMSPSTLSDHVISLENELGGALFERGGGFTLTRAGEQALERAQRVLMECDAMKRECSSHDGSFATIVFPNYAIGLKPFVSVRERFRAAHPDWRVTFRTAELQMADPFDVLADGLADVACLYTIEGSGQDACRLVPKGFRHVCVGSLDYVFLTTKGHPLAEKETLSVSDLDGTTFLTTLCPLSDIVMAGMTDLLARKGAHVQTIFRRLNRHDDIFAGDLDGYVIARWADADNARTQYGDGLVVHVADFPVKVDVHLVWDKDRLDAIQGAYMAQIADAARQGEGLL